MLKPDPLASVQPATGDIMAIESRDKTRRIAFGIFARRFKETAPDGERLGGRDMAVTRKPWSALLGGLLLASAVLVPMLTSCAGSAPTVGKWQTGWDSGVIQVQEGSKNVDKKKLVMRIWYEYLPYSDGTYLWRVSCSTWAEDHDRFGNGWHKVKELYSIGYELQYNIQALNYTASDYKDVKGYESYYLDLATGYALSSTQLPVFHAKTVTVTRNNGGTGLSKTWS